MSSFDYIQSKEMAYRLVDKFGTDCKVKTTTKTKSAKCVFMSNDKNNKPDGPVINTSKQVYVSGIDLDITPNDKLEVKNTLYLITSVELYNFDNKTKVLYILGIGK